MKYPRLFALFALSSLFASSALSAGCAAEADADPTASEDALVTKVDEHWMYAGPLPALESPKVTVSLKGHTARVTGYLPTGMAAPDLPHLRATPENGRTRLDIVYPIATAAPDASNSRPGREYAFHQARPYRPDGMAYPRSSPAHWVPWGGFPFLAYNGGIAFHGPITFRDSREEPDLDVWYLRRGQVSGGCNRMMGEHVVELAHVLGISMRKVYGANQIYERPTRATVRVVEGYDTFEGKLVDVDYPTDTGARRPASEVGPEGVAMFGSWIASEMPDGKDLPPDMKWQGGVRGDWYVFAEHARNDMVCSFAKRDLPKLKELVRVAGGELPRSICAKKECVVDGIRANRSAAQIAQGCELEAGRL